MKKIVVTIPFLLGLAFSFGQTVSIGAMVDSLKYLKADTLDCRADLYWRIVAQRDKAIPFLIDKLTDTTPTTVRFHCKRDRLNVGEIAQFALTDIGYFPASLVTKIQFDVDDDNGCWDFYDFLFVNSNKTRYQDSVRTWYDREKLKYKPVKISKSKLNECQVKYGIDTYYLWKE